MLAAALSGWSSSGGCLSVQFQNIPQPIPTVKQPAIKITKATTILIRAFWFSRAQTRHLLGSVPPAMRAVLWSATESPFS